MHKNLGSFIALNRRAILFTGLLVSVAVFGVLTWRIQAQRVTSDTGNQIAVSSRSANQQISAARKQRYLFDQQEAAESGPLPTDFLSMAQAPDLTQANPVIYAYDELNAQLISFNAQTPDVVIATIPLTGINTTNDEVLGSIDFRPSNGLLYGRATFIAKNQPDRLVTINLTTGAVTSVNAANTLAATSDLFLGSDFNPVVDRLRIIGSGDAIAPPTSPQRGIKIK